MDLIIHYAMSFLHQPYRWGGDDPSGFDCSGLVQEIGRPFGIMPPGDHSAHSLYLHFSKKENHAVKGYSGSRGFVFFGSPTKVTHVGFTVSADIMIDAAGGGPRVKTLEDAIKFNAFVKMSRISRRGDAVDVILPKYPLIY